MATHMCEAGCGGGIPLRMVAAAVLFWYRHLNTATRAAMLPNLLECNHEAGAQHLTMCPPLPAAIRRGLPLPEQDWGAVSKTRRLVEEIGDDWTSLTEPDAPWHEELALTAPAPGTGARRRPYSLRPHHPNRAREDHPRGEGHDAGEANSSPSRQAGSSSQTNSPSAHP